MKAQVSTAPSGPPPDAWASADPLGQTLHTLRMDGVVYAHSQLTAPWGVMLPPLPGCVMFHVVTAGQCELEYEPGKFQSLRPGQFALLPRGQGHGIMSQAGEKLIDFFDLPVERITPRYEMLTHGGGGELTTLICGAVRFEHPAAQELLALLPTLIHLQTWGTEHGQWMDSTLRLMAAEACGPKPGGETIVTRLADILVIQAIRHWLDQSPDAKTGWLGALQDPRIGPALVAIHQQPTGRWTVETLAEQVHMSRSAFAASFSERVGQTPMQYLTKWRMHVACHWLEHEDAGLAQCADRLGYTSEAAFSRAFKRTIGQSPGAWRKQAQAASVEP